MMKVMRMWVVSNGLYGWLTWRMQRGTRDGKWSSVNNEVVTGESAISLRHFLPEDQMSVAGRELRAV